MGTRPLKNLCEVAVIGGGLAGLAAAREAARQGRLVTLFEGSGLYGGQVATIGELDGLPFPTQMSGQDLAMPLWEDARKVGVQIVEASVDSLDLSQRITLTDSNAKVWHPEVVIVAAGASLRPLGVPGEERLMGRGVSRCATCDGGFYRGKDVAVVGGGDGAVHEALTLAKTSSRVFVVARRPLRAKREYIDKLAARDNVTFLWDSEVTTIEGENAVTGLALRNLRNGETSEIAVAGVFPFIGTTPNTGFLPAALRDATGHVPTDAEFASTDPRLFAAGAARAGFGGSAVQAMAEGVSAAMASVKHFAQLSS